MTKTHGQYKSSTYRSWRSMINRCELPSVNGYAQYGGRGITVDARWRASFEAFLADMGERPSLDHSIDRLDNNGNYEPDNCRWATRSEQQQNKRPFTRGETCRQGHIYAEVGVYLNKRGARQCAQCAKDRARVNRQ